MPACLQIRHPSSRREAVGGLEFYHCDTPSRTKLASTGNVDSYRGDVSTHCPLMDTTSSSSRTPERGHTPRRNGDVPHDHSNNYTNISAAGEARQHNGNVYNNKTNYYTIRQRRSDETLREGALNKTFLRAAAEGQTRRVEVLLERGADPDHTDEDDLTALHHACFSGFEDTVEVLLGMGFDVNAHSKLYGNPLCLAALKGRRNVVEILLSARANIEGHGGELGSALHAACYCGNLWTVKVLLDNELSPGIERVYRFESMGAPRLVGANGKTMIERYEGPALGVAASEGQLEIVNFLLNSKVDANVITNCTRSYLSYDGSEQNHLSNRTTGITLLMMAAAAGRYEVFPTLISRGADLCARDSNKHTALLHAIFHGTVQCASSLMTFGANIEEQLGKQGYNALASAAGAGRLDMLKLLSNKVSSLEARSARGMTALCVAAVMGHAQCMEWLLSKGADINCQDESGNTPLMHAAMYGQLSCVKLLLHHGADVSRASYQEGQTALHFAAYNRYFEIVESFVKGGANVDVGDAELVTPLMWAAVEGDTLMVEFLIGLGANVKVKDDEGNSALDHARERLKSLDHPHRKNIVRILKRAMN